MKTILRCFKMPHGTYIGGIAAMMNSYMANSSLFEKNGYEEMLFDYQNPVINKIKISPIETCIYGVYQYNSLKKRLNKESVNIVHIHTSRNSLFFKDVLLGQRIQKKTGVKVIMTVHVGDISTVFEKIPDAIKKWLIELINKYFSKIIFLTKSIETQFIDSGLQKEKAVVLYNFCDINVSKRKKSDSNKPLELLYVGMINRAKGILELLDALNTIDNHYDIHLSICGEITEPNIEEEFKQKINKLSGKVSVLGYVKGKQKEQLFENSDVLVLPSHHEGFPLVILEALSSGCSIITTRVGAIPEVLGRENCIFVEIGNSDSIKNAVERMYNNKQLICDMGSANLQLSERFSKENHINQLCSIYNEII